MSEFSLCFRAAGAHGYEFKGGHCDKIRDVGVGQYRSRLGFEENRMNGNGKRACYRYTEIV